MSKEKKKDNWFKRHKVLTAILGFVLLIIIVTAVGGGSESSNSNGSNSTSGKSAKAYRFNDRADKQEKDVEIVPNEAASLNDVTMSVTGVQYATSLGEYDTADAGQTYVVVDVTIQNNSDRAQPYNPYDFRIQTSGGQVLDPTIALGVKTMNSGDLVQGGKVIGKIVFEVPVEDGHQYLIWKPGWGSERAVVEIK